MRAEALIVYLWLLCGALTGCGGHGSAPPVRPVTIADPLAYLAQSRVCDGNPATPLSQGDPIACARYDAGLGVQANTAFLTPDGGATLTWSYPFERFDPAAEAGCPLSPCHGDGGEHYTIADGIVHIASTQDGGSHGVQHFPDWWAFDDRVPDCLAGWEAGDDGLGRACRAVITFPGLGSVDTVIGEHDGNHVERSAWGRGWGRIGWQSWAPSCPTPVDPKRAPAVSPLFDQPPSTHPAWQLCDERLNIILTPDNGSLSGADLWHPEFQ